MFEYQNVRDSFTYLLDKGENLSDFKKLHERLLTVGEERIEAIAPEVLNLYMTRFFLSIRKKNEKGFEPDSL